MVQSKALLLEKVQKACEKDKNLVIDQEFPQLVYGKGNSDAEIFFIGEAPGKNEALQGIPFVGSAGKNLNKLLESINLTLDDCYIANILKCRPTQNRNPTLEEIKSHTPYLIEQISIIKPKIIVPLGNFATKFVLSGFEVSAMKTISGITQLHGEKQKITIQNQQYVVIPQFHPAAMIYRPKLKTVIEEDFRKMQEFLQTTHKK